MEHAARLAQATTRPNDYRLIASYKPTRFMGNCFTPDAHWTDVFGVTHRNKEATCNSHG